jgi:hypothetical protein
MVLNQNGLMNLPSRFAPSGRNSGYNISQTADRITVRITTNSAETTDAVHAFLLFQIIDHKTGDSPAIFVRSPRASRVWYPPYRRSESTP